ncbi:hypothetical protein TURU_046091 [Turdus rufiventris]|nr:hypothetical protein TURU_046091 [Turdus rufiventris]
MVGGSRRGWEREVEDGNGPAVVGGRRRDGREPSGMVLRDDEDLSIKWNLPGYHIKMPQGVYRHSRMNKEDFSEKISVLTQFIVGSDECQSGAKEENINHLGADTEEEGTKSIDEIKAGTSEVNMSSVPARSAGSVHYVSQDGCMVIRNSDTEAKESVQRDERRVNFYDYKIHIENERSSPFVLVLEQAHLWSELVQVNKLTEKCLIISLQMGNSTPRTKLADALGHLTEQFYMGSSHMGNFSFMSLKTSMLRYETTGNYKDAPKHLPYLTSQMSQLLKLLLQWLEDRLMATLY